MILYFRNVIIIFLCAFGVGCREKKPLEVSMTELNMRENGRYYMKGRYDPFTGIAFHEKLDQRISQSVLVEGLREGKHTVFWPETGGKRSTGTFREGFRDGLFTNWNEDGDKVSESGYQGDSLEGPYREWFPGTGAIKVEGSYESAKRAGIWTTYYDDPELEYQEVGDRRKFEETKYDGGRIHGKKREWTINGLLVYEGSYQEGQMNGRHDAWYPSGVKKESKFYTLGRPSGQHREWHPNGQLKYETIYGPDGLPGAERYWDAAGKELDYHPDDPLVDPVPDDEPEAGSIPIEG